MRALSNYSDDELIEELAKRRNARETERPVRWCENCEHYKTWAKDSDPPDSYNPCSKKHKMHFRVPEQIDDEYGYYRRVCADRKDRADVGA